MGLLAGAGEVLVASDPAARRMLEAAPPNGRARFFDFDINHEGCAISVC